MEVCRFCCLGSTIDAVQIECFSALTVALRFEYKTEFSKHNRILDQKKLDFRKNRIFEHKIEFSKKIEFPTTKIGFSNIKMEFSNLNRIFEHTTSGFSIKTHLSIKPNI